MQLGDVITEARKILQDTSTVDSLQRYSDADLLGFANQTLKRMALVRPDLFSYIGEITCTTGEVLQSAPSDSIRIMEIFRVKDGSSIRETNREILDQTYPAWQSDAAAACSSWMRHPRNQNKFFIYPKAPSGQILIGEYAKYPSDYAADDEVELLPDAFFPCVVDGTVYLAESIDDESVNSNRAKLYQDSFFNLMDLNLKSRVITDNERGGLDKSREQEKMGDER